MPYASGEDVVVGDVVHHDDRRGTVSAIAGGMVVVDVSGGQERWPIGACRLAVPQSGLRPRLRGRRPAGGDLALVRPRPDEDGLRLVRIEGHKKVAPLLGYPRPGRVPEGLQELADIFVALLEPLAATLEQPEGKLTAAAQKG